MPATKQHTVFALVDCNNFFASCERLFRPELATRPIVVLSSNDGCVVARSDEAKALGIPMGAPAFSYRALYQQHNVAVFSGNFALYGNISKRVTAILSTLAPRIEVYSVDESFLDISTLPINDYLLWGRHVKSLILRLVGIPVSVGIAPTKTLCKAATDIAKKRGEYKGAYSFVNLGYTAKQAALSSLPIQDVWGIGRHLAPKLRAEGIPSAQALAELPPKHAQQLLGIRGRQTVSELNTVSCFAFASHQQPAQSIMRSRTFGEDTSNLGVIEAATATLSARASKALRHNHMLAKTASICINTNRHKPGYRRWELSVQLDTPTSDAGIISSLLLHTFSTIYNQNQHYHRLGIFLRDFVPTTALQLDLPGNISPTESDRSQAKLNAVDRINQSWGNGTIKYAAELLNSSWQPKHSLRSPRYVSSWQDLPAARILKDV